MFLSIKKTLPLWVLVFTCFCLHGAETEKEDPYPIIYELYIMEDYIELELILPEGIKSPCTLCKINTPNSKGVKVRMKSVRPECLENSFQLGHIEAHIVSSQTKGELKFEIIKTLEQYWDDSDTIKRRIVDKKVHHVALNKPIALRDDVVPKLTRSKTSPNIKYIKFFTKP